jgi:hypothetical protein
MFYQLNGCYDVETVGMNVSYRTFDDTVAKRKSRCLSPREWIDALCIPSECQNFFQQMAGAAADIEKLPNSGSTARGSSLEMQDFAQHIKIDHFVREIQDVNISMGPNVS